MTNPKCSSCGEALDKVEPPILTEERLQELKRAKVKPYICSKDECAMVGVIRYLK